jgi:hypothetical protein
VPGQRRQWQWLTVSCQWRPPRSSATTSTHNPCSTTTTTTTPSATPPRELSASLCQLVLFPFPAPLALRLLARAVKAGV